MTYYVICGYLAFSLALALAIGQMFRIRHLEQQLSETAADLEATRRAAHYRPCAHIGQHGRLCHLPAGHHGEHQSFTGRMLAAEWTEDAA